MLLEFDTLTHDMNDKQYKILVRSYEKMDTDGIGWTTHKQTCTKVLIEKKTVVKNCKTYQYSDISSVWEKIEHISI